MRCGCYAPPLISVSRHAFPVQIQGIRRICSTTSINNIHGEISGHLYRALMFRGFEGDPKFASHDGERRKSLGQLYV